MQALECFESQNYINKELVVSCLKQDQSTKGIIKVFQQNTNLNIQILEREPEDSACTAKYKAIQKCHGDYICFWDDNNWHHSSRLSFQFNSIQRIGYGYKASIMMRVFLYDHMTKLSYLSLNQPWDQTLLCKKEMILHNQIVNENRLIDMDVIALLESKKLLAHIDESPFLYIYSYHSNNPSIHHDFKHHINISTLLSEEMSSKIRNILGD